MKWETSEPDFPKGVNSCEISYTTVPNTWCNHMQLEWKGELKATQNMVKGFNKVFKTVVKDISQNLYLVESVSEIFHFSPEPRNFSEITKNLDDIKRPWLEATKKYIKNLINKSYFSSSRSREG